MEKPKLEEGWLRWSRERMGDSGWFSVFLGEGETQTGKSERRGGGGSGFERFCRQDAGLEIRVNYLISWKINCIAS